MGSCVSVHRNPDSAMKVKLSFGSKSDKFAIPSPIKEKPANVDRSINDVGLKSGLSPANFGSKEETFFDSQPWLDSDCDEDFFSVNGDFTPSRGSTPVHQSIYMGTPQVNKFPFEDRVPGSNPEPSPADKKKKLSELFRESMGDDQDVDDHNVAPPKSRNSTPYVSGVNSLCSSERTPNGDFKPEKEKSIRSVQCCLPRLLSSHSFNERNKKMSMAPSSG